MFGSNAVIHNVILNPMLATMIIFSFWLITVEVNNNGSITEPFSFKMVRIESNIVKTMFSLFIYCTYSILVSIVIPTIMVQCRYFCVFLVTVVGQIM